MTRTPEELHEGWCEKGVEDGLGPGEKVERKRLKLRRRGTDIENRCETRNPGILWPQRHASMFDGQVAMDVRWLARRM